MKDPPGTSSQVRKRRGNTDNNSNDDPHTGKSNDASTTNENDTDNTDGTAQQPQQRRRQQQTPQNAMFQFIFRTAVMYFMFQMYNKSKSDSATTSQPDITDISTNEANGKSGSGVAAGANVFLNKLGIRTTEQPEYYSKSLFCHWKTDFKYDVRIFFSSDPDFDFNKAASSSSPIWSISSLSYSTHESNYHAKNFTVNVPEQVSQHNSSWFAHIFVVKGGLWDVVSKSGPVTDAAIQEHVLYTRHDLVTWIDVNLNKKGKHLLGGDKEEEEECKQGDDTCKSSTSIDDDNNTTSVRYDQVWKPSLPVVLIIGNGVVTLSQLPPPASEMFKISPDEGTFYPPMHVEEFWHLRDHMKLMNGTVKDITIELSFKPISLYKWSLFRQFDNVWRRQVEFGAMGKGEVDEMKRMFIETNIILLVTTMVVSMAHSILEGLAFKNDISHWRNIKSMEGVSVRSMVWKIVMELIIFLYLFDNDTSWMIVIGNGVGLVIEVWKLCKAVKFKRKRSFPWFIIEDHESYSKETKEYDDQAMKYLSYVMLPLVICYALYSLKYDTHKSWYSWIVNSLVGAVYAFGFILMFPQVFINYKLKSVAHLPMKAMMYKTLNTVIDDLFSFIIKMPWLHRLACFRDDIVFLILLYQRYLYPTDYTRVNEFGQQFNDNGNNKNTTGAGGTESAPAIDDNNDEGEGEGEGEGEVEGEGDDVSSSVMNDESSTNFGVNTDGGDDVKMDDKMDEEVDEMPFKDEDSKKNE